MKLSPTMQQMLLNQFKHGNLLHGIHGRARQNAAWGTRIALFKRGLLTKEGELTPQGNTVARSLS